MHEHRSVLSQQLSDLKLAGRSRTTVRQRLATLKKDTAQQQMQLNTLQKVISTLRNTIPSSESGDEKAEVVAIKKMA